MSIGDVKLNCEIGEVIYAIHIPAVDPISGIKEVQIENTGQVYSGVESPECLTDFQYNYLIKDEFDLVYLVQSIDLLFD